MMQYRASERPGVRLPAAAKAFSKASPLPEGLRQLPDMEVLRVLSLFHQKNPSREFVRFCDARDRLVEQFGGRVDAVELPRGGMGVAARLEFPTCDRTISADLYDYVAGMGFELVLRSLPMGGTLPDELYERRTFKAPDGSETAFFERRMERVYVITERRYGTSDVSRIASTAEGLLRLADMLLGGAVPEKAGTVVEMPSSRPRPSQAPPPTRDESSVAALKVSAL